MKKIIIPALFVVLLVSCQKEVTIDIPPVEQKIVVDGGIFTGEPAELNLTWSAGYFDAVDSASLAQYLITNATVIVSDGAMQDTLHLTYDNSRILPLVWKGNSIIGQVGHTYHLSVTVNGTTVTSVSTIPTPVPLDSTWFKLEPGKDSLGFAWAHLTDPPVLGNCYRWFAKRLGKDNGFLAPLGSAFDDKFVNGQSFDFAYNRGAIPGSTAADDNNDEAGYFKIGDTIAVQYCSIGQNEEQFFRSYETQVGNNGNPFAAPGVVKSNVSGGLGIFCAYAATYDTIVCH